MLIQETGRQTGLTKKAIVYYVEQGLVAPAVLENGYRDFSPEDVERLRRIAVLRRLGLGTGEIRQVFSGESAEQLQRISVQRELDAQADRTKAKILARLAGGAAYDAVLVELDAAACAQSVAERLLEAFPGYYGRFICLHFARFLQEPACFPEQRAAYETVTAFLDGIPPLAFPEELDREIRQYTAAVDAEAIAAMQKSAEGALEAPERFLTENAEVLDQYLEFRKSEEYRSSLAGRLQSLLWEFNRASGYCDVFIPAMKRLSPAYAVYCEKLEAAERVLEKRYPEAAELAAEYRRME